MVQWRHRQSVAAPSLWFASRKERTETPHRRHSRPARPPCAASAPINIIRPENIMTSNYSFHGNTLALHGGALHHPNICTYCFCTRQKIVLRPRQPFKGLFEYGDVRAFHKDYSCTLTRRWKCGVLPQVPGWDFWHRLGKTIPDVKRAWTKHCKWSPAKPDAWQAARRAPDATSRWTRHLFPLGPIIVTSRRGIHKQARVQFKLPRRCPLMTSLPICRRLRNGERKKYLIHVRVKRNQETAHSGDLSESVNKGLQWVFFDHELHNHYTQFTIQQVT